jgi:guanylate kinase
VNAILKEDSKLRYSISYTTRAPRGDERNGVEYHFISDAEFRKKIDRGEFIEWEEVHGHMYGSSAEFVEESLSQGYDVVFDIDVKGAGRLYAKYPEAILVFIKPPSMEVLRARLAGRGTDSTKVIQQRMKNAEAEMSHAAQYHHVIVNDDLDEAVSRLRVIIEKMRG